MAAKLTDILFNWLRASGINISRPYLDAQLQTHPDYPSLLSITDTLDDLGIENLSLVVDRERLRELPLPFLAYHDSDPDKFIIVSDIQQQVLHNLSFQSAWGGIVVLINQPESWHHIPNDNALKKVRSTSVGWLLSLLLLVALLTAAQFSFSGLMMLRWLVTLTGLGLAVLIVQKELGINSSIGLQLCGTDDCGVVTGAGRSVRPLNMSWSDSGIIYFSSLVILYFSVPDTTLIALIAAAGVPFIFYSLYYQWRIARKWCRLCLAMLCVLMVQFILWLPALPGATTHIFNARFFLYPAAVFYVAGLTWLRLLKPAIEKQRSLTTSIYALLRLKNNAGVFMSLLQQQKRVDTGRIKGDIVIGEPHAINQLIVLCQPFCTPCAQAHLTLDELSEVCSIGITFRFMVNASRKENASADAALHLLSLANGSSGEFNKKMLHAWYKCMDMAEFKNTYPLNGRVLRADDLRDGYEWAIKEGIRFTPTVFFNGYELPPQYQLTELKALLKQQRPAGAASGLAAI